MKELTGITVWTIGHSTRAWDDFVEILHAHRITCVADVRRFPGSRKFPHFGADAMARILPEKGIEYLPLPALGGRRKPRPDSPNMAWRNAAFRAYADYMETEEYHIGRRTLVHVVRRIRTTLLCSEAVWWRCHRGLIADDLKVSGAEVLHITSRSPPTEHPYTSAARIVQDHLTYQASHEALFNPPPTSDPRVGTAGTSPGT